MSRISRSLVAVLATVVLLASLGNAAGCARHGGSKWSTMTSGTASNLSDVWGSSVSHVFAVGHEVDSDSLKSTPIIWHYDGFDWSAMGSGSEGSLFDVWGSSSSDVFAVGFPGTILHYNGTRWSAMNSGTEASLSGVWGSSPSDVFVVGTHIEGNADPDGVLPHGIILHYDGSDWSLMDIGSTEGLVAVWGSSPSDVFAVGILGTILHYDGNAWTHMPVPTGTRESLVAVWGSSSTDVFAAGNQTEWGSDPDPDSVVYHPTILHYDGSIWRTMPVPTDMTDSLRSVWGSSSSDVFAAGSSGLMLHYDGSAWTRMSSGTDRGISGVWGTSASDVFAVGEGGTILHYAG